MIKENKKSSFKEIIEFLKENKGIRPDASGGSCSVFYLKDNLKNKREKPHTALLKKKLDDEVFPATEYVRQFNKKQVRCLNLQKKGVNIALPKDFYFSSKEGCIYESQQFALGEIIGISSPMTAVGRFLNNEFIQADVEKLKNLRLDKSESELIAREVVSYNLNMLGKLLRAKNEHIIKFLSDYKTIIKNDVYVDNNPENFFYDKQVGVTFIDIGEESYATNAEKVSDIKIYDEFKSIFSLPESLTCHMNTVQKKMLEQKTNEFFAKADSLTYQAGYDFAPALEQ